MARWNFLKILQIMYLAIDIQWCNLRKNWVHILVHETEKKNGCQNSALIIRCWKTAGAIKFVNRRAKISPICLMLSGMGSSYGCLLVWCWITHICFLVWSGVMYRTLVLCWRVLDALCMRFRNLQFCWIVVSWTFNPHLNDLSIFQNIWNWIPQHESEWHETLRQN